MIAKIRIENWKSHKRTELEFEPGTNVLIGINGAGKTSVLDAIVFALFGKVPSRRFESILRRGMESGSVELVFYADGEEYKVRRTFSARGIRECELRVNGQLKGVKSSEITEIIEKVLGVSQKVFLESVYARQNEIANILELTAQKRKEFFDDLLELKGLETARATLKSVIHRIADEIRRINVIELEANRARIAQQVEKLQAEIEKDRKELTEREREKETLKEAQATLEKNVKLLEKTMSALESRMHEKRRIEGEIRTLEEEYKKITSEYGVPKEGDEDELVRIQEKLEDAEHRFKNLQELREKLKKLKGNLEMLEDEISRLDTEYSKDEYEALLQKRKELETVLKEKQNELIEITRKKGALEGKLRTLNERIRELCEKRKKVWETLASVPVEDIKEVERAIQEVEKDLEAAITERGKIKAQIHVEETFLSTLGSDERCPLCLTPLKKGKIEEIKRIHEKNLHELENALNNIEKHIRAMQQRTEKLRKLLPLIEQIGSVEKEIEVVERHLKETKREMEEVETQAKNIQRELDGLKEEYEALNKKITEIEKKIENAQRKEELKKKKAEIIKELETAQKQIQEIGEVSQDYIQTLRKKAQELEKRVQALKFRKRIQAAHKELEKIANVEEQYEKKKMELENMQKTLVKTQTRLEAVSDKIDMLRESIRRAEDFLQNLKDQLEQVDSALARVRRLEAIKTALLSLETIVKKTQETVRQQRIAALNSAMNVIWGKIEPHGGFPSIRLRPTESDYILEVKRSRGEWVDVKVLSGGERALAALTLRIALSSLVAKKIGWLLLDEPTHNLDAQATETLTAVLRDLPSEGLFAQIILITHDERLQSAATGAVYILERDKTTDAPTSVRRVL